MVPDFSTTTDSGQAYATVPFPEPADLFDNSGGAVTVTTSPSDGAQLSIGVHEVTYTVSDPNGNSVDFTVMVTVQGKYYYHVKIGRGLQAACALSIKPDLNKTMSFF